jgi:hypothetical protein
MRIIILMKIQLLFQLAVVREILKKKINGSEIFFFFNFNFVELFIFR